jgi:hypothetical protein
MYLKMETIKLILIALILISCGKNEFIAGEVNQDVIITSFNEIIKNSINYHDEIIEVSGYFNYSFENVSIYHKLMSDKNEAIWIDFSPSINKILTENDLISLQGKKVIVQGRYDNDSKGHLGLFLGTVTIDYIELIK